MTKPSTEVSGRQGYFKNPNMGMMQPNMGTIKTGSPADTTLADALFPKVRQRVLAVLFGMPDRSFYANEVIALAQSGTGAVQRELALIKVAGKGEARIEALRLAEIFRAHVVDSTLESFVFEMTGTPDKIDSFADLMRPLGLREIARTGVAALARGV